jgi:hypothetical protein
MSDVASEVVMYVSLTELKNTFQFCTKATVLWVLTIRIWNIMFSGRMEADERPVYEYLEFGCGYERGIHQNVNKPRLSTHNAKHDFMRHISESLFPRRTVRICLTTSQINKDLNRAGGVSAGFCETCRIRIWRCAATVPELLPRVKTQNSYYATNGTTSQNICVILVALYTGDWSVRKIVERR